jgi:hypothetical protein
MEPKFEEARMNRDEAVGPGSGDWILELAPEEIERILDAFERERAEREIPRKATSILIGHYTVLVGGGANNVPSPDCMASHLPKDRRPTAEELKRAWEACTQ